tara:strand:+ start:381 stop:506 length:126 start_codon:yes stop_codon:yes gene_type:complete
LPDFNDGETIQGEQLENTKAKTDKIKNLVIYIKIFLNKQIK